MVIYLYNCVEPDNKIDKSLPEPAIMEGAYRESNVDTIRPSILIQDPHPQRQYNYCYIPELHRYYFIRDWQSVRHELWRIDCEVDVLKTYAQEIKNQQVIINKQQSNFVNTYIDDGDWICTNKIFMKIIPFPYKMCEGAQWILQTVGSPDE